jgi:hypothetical protein
MLRLAVSAALLLAPVAAHAVGDFARRLLEVLHAAALERAAIELDVLLHLAADERLVGQHLQRGARVDEVRDRLGLHQVDLAAEHRALGELARLRHQRAQAHRGAHHALDDQRAAVQRQFHQVVAGERVRRRVADGDALI